MYLIQNPSNSDELIQNSQICLSNLTPSQMCKHQWNLQRYKRLIGLNCIENEIQRAEFESDCVEYAQYIPKAFNGAVLDYELCAQFMSCVSKSSVNECFSFIYLNS